MAHRRLPPAVAGRAPRRGRLRAGACRWLMPKFSIRRSSNGLRRAQGVALPLDCPHIGAGAGPLSACPVRLPFAGEDRSDASDAGQSRAVSVAPGASLALRLKLRRLKRPGACACGRRANHSIVGLQRLRPSRGVANRRERLDGCPFNSLLRRTNVLERAPLQQRSNKYGFAGRLASMLYRERGELAGQLSAI